MATQRIQVRSHTGGGCARTRRSGRQLLNVAWLRLPRAVLHNDVRSNGSATEPVLLLIGSPMDAAGFGTLAGHFTGRRRGSSGR